MFKHLTWQVLSGKPAQVIAFLRLKVLNLTLPGLAGEKEIQVDQIILALPLQQVHEGEIFWSYFYSGLLFCFTREGVCDLLSCFDMTGYQAVLSIGVPGVGSAKQQNLIILLQDEVCGYKHRWFSQFYHQFTHKLFASMIFSQGATPTPCSTRQARVF